jgi:hypothetical protein
MDMEAEMASAAQLAANRANAERSTGPKTEAGKAASARNALKHGLCAEKLLIDEEEAAAWEALRADYLDRLAPVGPAEERLADRIAQVAWRRDRGSSAEAAAWRGFARGGWLVGPKGVGKQRWHEDADPTVAARATPIMNGIGKELLRLTAYEGRLTRELVRLKAELAELQKARWSRQRAERAWAAEQARRAEREKQVADILARRQAAGGEAGLAPPSEEARCSSWRAGSSASRPAWSSRPAAPAPPSKVPPGQPLKPELASFRQVKEKANRRDGETPRRDAPQAPTIASK